MNKFLIIFKNKAYTQVIRIRKTLELISLIRKIGIYINI